MRGVLLKTSGGWIVREYDGKHPAFREHTLLPSQVDEVQASISTMVDNDKKEVNFELVDEFTHPQLYRNVPWGEGQTYARIVNI